MMPLQQAAQVAEISYRQAHHWVVQKEMIPMRWQNSAGEEVEKGGKMNGFHAYLDPYGLRMLLLMARLVRAGLEHEPAAAIAQHLAAGARSVKIADGLVLLNTDLPGGEAEGFDADASL